MQTGKKEKHQGSSSQMEKFKEKNQQKLLQYMSNKSFKKPTVIAMDHSSFNSRFVHRQDMDDLIASRMMPAGKIYKESVADTVRPVVDNENRKRYKTQGQDNLSKDPYEEFKLYEKEN